MSCVALIPAKGSSTRIPRKNLRFFHGKPILAYSIQTVKDSGLFDRIIVSTDDDEVDTVARRFGAEVLRRGPEWSGDDVGPLDVARHTLSQADADLMCVVYATAPLLRVEDLKRGHFLMGRTQLAYALSVGATPFLHDAAQFIWCSRYALEKRIPEFAETTVMIPVSPERDCDINTEEDWQRCERMYAKLHGCRHEYKTVVMNAAFPEMTHFICIHCGEILPT